MDQLKNIPNIKGKYCLEFVKITNIIGLQTVQIYIKINKEEQNIKINHL